MMNPSEEWKDGSVAETPVPRGDATAKWLRWLARGIGSTVTGLWLFIGVLHGIGDSEQWTWESTIITVLVAALALGVLIGWWREAIGGGVLVVVAMAFSAFAWVTAGHNKGFAILISGGPFLVAGILLLMSWRRTGKQPEVGANRHGEPNGRSD
jgi:hypothetical protein